MLTQARLKALVSYDPETGQFTSLVSRGPRQRGDVLGCKKRYVCLTIDQRTYSAHRLAWLYVHRSWPSAMIDHINGDPFDNRLINLREADGSKNQANRRKMVGTVNTLKGANFHRASGKWQAAVTVRGRFVYLGLFSTEEEAHAAYVAGAKKYFGEFARTA